MRLHAQVWHKFRGAPFKKMVAICTAVEQVKQRRMPKRASDGDTDSRDPPEVIAIRRKARVSGRYRYIFSSLWSISKTALWRLT